LIQHQLLIPQKKKLKRKRENYGRKSNNLKDEYHYYSLEDLLDFVNDNILSTDDDDEYIDSSQRWRFFLFILFLYFFFFFG
jgi:hypothetical protein